MEVTGGSDDDAISAGGTHQITVTSDSLGKAIAAGGRNPISVTSGSYRRSDRRWQKSNKCQD
ncbi:hypothetical protein [Laspinema olomoucense]|uniref:hypothetical protein n=1 Tax=Laspinema olomoucense TaxID=3231600 RepID=UPI0021BB4090|nr:hypothetical protein [Laspinema sp. D3d]MCT7975213.1 hypothetical protein [Laspinema sp. D3d]